MPQCGKKGKIALNFLFFKSDKLEVVMKKLFQITKTLYTRIQRDRLFREASALTYQSFLALVPMLAILFGVAKGFGLDTFLENWIRLELKDHKEILVYFLQFSQTTLQQASGGIIAGIGVFFLLFTAVQLLSAVETVLTAMWGFHLGRSCWRKISDYLAIILICPVLLAVSSSATIFATTRLASLSSTFATARPLFSTLLTLLPFLTSALLFSLILFAMPCAPIRFRSAAIAGTIAAVTFQFVQAWYIIFQLRLTKVSAIYGSFVALPLFLVWLWISWLLLLIAGEIAVFIQEKGWRQSCLQFTNSPLEKFEIDASILAHVVRYFQEEKPIDIKDIFLLIPVPIQALTSSIERLGKKGLLHLGQGQSYSSALIPSKKTNTLTLSDLLFPEGQNIPETELTMHIEKTLNTWKSDLLKSSANTKLIDFLRK